MNHKIVGRFISQILLIEAAFYLPALALCLWDGDGRAVAAFLWTLIATVAVAGGLLLLCRKTSAAFYAKEGLVCVGVSWIVMSLLGCLPFFLSGAIPSFIDALFETVSGFSTTGASILTDIESLPRGLLYWRSFTHWVGGMGVLVFLLAVTPATGKGGGFTMHLLRAESPGPDVAKLVPRMRKTATILYLVYLGLTALNFLFLLFGGMHWFDAVCTAFGTAGTGGFAIRSDSLASYSPYIQNVCTVFMLLCGVNFSCHYLLLLGHVRSVFRDEELRLYLGLFAGCTLLITWNLRGFYATLEETVRHAAFQVASIMTTTGFATADFDLWPGFSKAILLCLMLVGACAGSTGGGLKCARLLLLVKSLRRNVQRLLHPQRVLIVRSNGRRVPEQVLDNTSAYLAAYAMILAVSFLVVSLDGFSVTTNLSAVLACFNNIGPGLEMVGPNSSYAGYGLLSKLVLIADMLAGRLEIFPILILFPLSTWRKG